MFSKTGGRNSGQGNTGRDGVRQQFTAKERDVETGLDYFLARYYSSTQGRFTSADEFSGGPDELYDFAEAASENPTFYADLTNPQSLNKYQYTYNNPVNMTDEDAHCPICAVVVEVVGTVVDVVTTVRSLRDPNASTTEKVATTIGTAVGIVIPGVAGTGALTKGIVKRVAKRGDDAVDASKAVTRLKMPPTPRARTQDSE